jgi:hypothetical protein
MEIQVTVRSAYGTPRIYPVNQAALILAALVGSKTLSKEHLERAMELGHTVVYVADPKLLASLP